MRPGLPAQTTSQQWGAAAVDSSSWEVAQDDDGGFFYYNSGTGESTYSRPDGAIFESATTSQTEGEGLLSAASGVAHEENGGAFLHEEWESAEGDDGGYWYNRNTGESSWVDPGA